MLYTSPTSPWSRRCHNALTTSWTWTVLMCSPLVHSSCQNFKLLFFCHKNKCPLPSNRGLPNYTFAGSFLSHCCTGALQWPNIPSSSPRVLCTLLQLSVGELGSEVTGFVTNIQTRQLTKSSQISNSIDDCWSHHHIRQPGNVAESYISQWVGKP